MQRVLSIRWSVRAPVQQRIGPLLPAWALFAATGCTDVTSSFQCTSSAQCATAERDGVCEPTGFCSAPSAACASGRVYDSSSAPALRGRCTDVDLGVDATSDLAGSSADLAAPDASVANADQGVADLRAADLLPKDALMVKPDMASPDLLLLDLGLRDFATGPSGAMDFASGPSGAMDFGSGDLSPPFCARVPSLLCDDFEQGLQDFWQVPSADGGTAKVAIGSPPSLNSKALQLTYPGATLKAGDFSGEWVFNRQELTFLPSPTDFFITASYFVSGSIDPGAQLLMLQQWDSPYHWVSIGAPFGAAGQLTLSSSIPSTGAAMTAAQPASRWFCLTLHVSQSFVGLSIDGTMMSGQTLQSTTVGGFAPTPRWGKLHVGYVVQNPPLTIAAAKDVWIDDIVVSTSPPDCQK